MHQGQVISVPGNSTTPLSALGYLLWSLPLLFSLLLTTGTVKANEDKEQPADALLRLEIIGGSDKLQQNILGYLPPLPTQNSQVAWFLRQVEIKSTRAAQALGYYRAQIDINLIQTQTPWLLQLTVEPGEPVVLTEANYDIESVGGADETFVKFVANAPLQVGSIVDHGNYQKTKQTISQLALSRGYFDARWQHSRINVSPDFNQAKLNLRFNTGLRYQYGDIVFSDSPFRESLLRRFLKFDTGEYYLAEDISRTQADLVSSGYFSRATVIPESEFTQESSPYRKQPPQLPIRIELTAAKRNELKVGTGYSTDRRLNVKLAWSRPWVNSRGHSIDTEFELGEVIQQWTIGYRVPLKDPIRDSFRTDLGVQQEKVADIDTVRAGIAFSRSWFLENEWRPKLYLSLGREFFTQLNQEGTGDEDIYITLLTPGGALSYLKQDDDFYPLHGYRLQFQLEAAHPALISDIQLIRPHGLGRFLVTIGDRWRLFSRVEAGLVASDRLRDVPPSYRFYAGGDQSIRGYGYRELGPKENGKVVGGRNLLVGSAQVGVVFGNWEPVVFADGGSVWTSSFDNQFRSSIGAGIHWRSPIGAVRLYIAKGMIQAPDNFRIHFGLGPEL